MEIREFTEADWAQVWAIVREVVRARETFPYDPAMTELEARAIWIEPPPDLTVVAVELYKRLGFEVVGTVPGAFEHPTLGRVGLHVMYRELS